MAKIYLSIGINNPPTGAKNMVQVDAYTLFPDDFMQSYTRHRNIVNFMEAIGSSFSESESHKLNNGNYDGQIRQHTNFKSWEAMCEAAMAYYEDQKDI